MCAECAHGVKSDFVAIVREIVLRIPLVGNKGKFLSFFVRNA